MLRGHPANPSLKSVSIKKSFFVCLSAIAVSQATFNDTYIFSEVSATNLGEGILYILGVIGPISIRFTRFSLSISRAT